MSCQRVFFFSFKEGNRETKTKRLCMFKKPIQRLCLTSVSAGAPRLFGHTRAPDDGSSCRLECIHVGVLQTRRVAEVFLEGLSGEMLLTRLLMDLCCLPVRSEMPLFTLLAHVRELNGDAVRRLRPMGHLNWPILMFFMFFVQNYTLEL